MNLNSKAKKNLGILVVILTLVLVWRHFQPTSPITSSPPSGKKTASNGAPTAAMPTASSNAAVKEALHSLFDNLKKMGAIQEVPPIPKQIQDAIDTKDTGKIMRAFHDAIYYQGSKMSEAIPALQEYLNDADPWIRFQAAEDLYIAGDNSGCDALISILQTGHSIQDFDGSDLRVQVAKLLEKYREKRAVNSLIEYSRRPGNTWAIQGLAKMARGALPDDIVKVVTSSTSPLIIYDILLIDPMKAKDLAASTFENPKVQKIYQQEAKIEAAWAMLLVGEKEPYYSYLMDFAKDEVGGKVAPFTYGRDPYEYSFKILASIKDPDVKTMLEGALNNKDSQVVEIALVNLYFNQGGSDKAKQYLLNQFQGPTNLLADSDFDMQLAAAINDPQINAAAQSVDDRTETSRWAYFEDRKNWSVYTWIGDYVVDLNGSRQIP